MRWTLFSNPVWGLVPFLVFLRKGNKFTYHFFFFSWGRRLLMTNSETKVKAIFEAETTTHIMIAYHWPSSMIMSRISIVLICWSAWPFSDCLSPTSSFGVPLTRPSCNIVIFPSLISTMKDNKMTASTRQIIVFMLCSTRLRCYQQVSPRCFLARS